MEVYGVQSTEAAGKNTSALYELTEGGTSFGGRVDPTKFDDETDTTEFVTHWAGVLGIVDPKRVAAILKW